MIIEQIKYCNLFLQECNIFLLEKTSQKRLEEKIWSKTTRSIQKIN